MRAHRVSAHGLMALLWGAWCALPALGGCAERAVLIPAPQVDETPAHAAGAAASESIVLAGGCFWGVQGVFQHLNGVLQAVSGYAGGTSATAQYETVSSGTTGHAESVRITYDPAQVTLGTILRVYFSVAHNPTEFNRQGPDHGTQYRSAIFVADEDQRRIAQSYIAQLDRAGVYPAPIATRIEKYQGFYPAEDYHQDFATIHPDHSYIVYNDLPKIRALEALYPQLYRTTPRLVLAGNATAIRDKH